MIQRPGLLVPRAKQLVLPGGGRFHIEQVRRGKIIRTWDFHNDLVYQGMNHMLDVTFGNSSPVTQKATWYIGLINNDPVPTPSVNDTLASHSGWVELTATSQYDGRKAWNDANAASGVKASSSVSQFTIAATVEVYGMFVCSEASGTSGYLWSVGAFDSPGNFVNTDVVNVQYSYTIGS